MSFMAAYKDNVLQECNMQVKIWMTAISIPDRKIMNSESAKNSNLFSRSTLFSRN